MSKPRYEWRDEAVDDAIADVAEMCKEMNYSEELINAHVNDFIARIAESCPDLVWPIVEPTRH